MLLLSIDTYFICGCIVNQNCQTYQANMVDITRLISVLRRNRKMSCEEKVITSKANSKSIKHVIA